MREGNLVLSPDLVPHDDLVDIIELIPVLILILLLLKVREVVLNIF